MTADAPILIYCRWEAAGGVERVSLRLRDFLRRNGIAAEIVCRGGGYIFGAQALAVEGMSLKDRTLVFSRKRDLVALGPRARAAQLIYWRHIPVVGPALRRVVDRTFLALISRRARIVCVCDELGEELRAIPGLRRASVHSILSPLGAALPPRVPIRAAPAARSFVHVGRPGGQKRLDLILPAVALARAAGHDVALTVYGYPAPAHPPEGVTFALPGTDPIPALATADALIVWSDYEGFPTIMVEAARAGCPILANDFRTGLADFERLIGPTVRIEDSADAFAPAFTGLPTGHYDLSGVRDVALWPSWADVLGLSGTAEGRKSESDPANQVCPRVSDV